MAYADPSKPPIRCATREIAELPAVRWTLWVLAAWWMLQAGLDRPHHLGKAQDWAYFNQHAMSAWVSWTHYLQVPQWEPFSCGGIPAIGNLQGTPVGLTQLLAALFGPQSGQRLASFVFVLLGMEGAFRYARHRGIRGLGAVTAGLLFGMSGRFVQLFHDGQPVFLSFELTPAVLLCLEKGWRSWRWAIGGGFVMALLFMEGGAVPTPLVSVLLGYVVLMRTAVALWRRGGDGVPWWRPGTALAVMAAVTVGLTLWRLLPVAESLMLFPREWKGDDVYSIGHVFNMELRYGPKQGYTADGSSLVGMGAALLFGVAVLGRDRRAPWVLALTLLSIDLATGSSEGVGTFRLVKALPVLDNLRNPFRFTVFAALFVAIGAGCGVSVIEDRLLGVASRFDGAQRRAAQAVAITIAVWAAMGPTWQLLNFGHTRLSEVFIREVPRHAVQPFRQSIGNRWVADVWPSQHRGSLSCFEEQPFFQAPGLRGDRPAEEFVDPPAMGTATRVSWSPHRIEVDVRLSKPAQLVVNQNHHRAWSADPGAVFRRKDGLIGVKLPAGSHRVVLRFSDPLITGGFGVTLLTLAVVALLAWRSRRRRRPPD